MIDHATVEGIGKREGTARVGVEFSPFLAAVAAGGEVVHALFPSLIAQIIVGTEGVELGRIYVAEAVCKLLHTGNVAPQFVAQGKHHERRMMPVLCNDVGSFFIEECHQVTVVFLEIAPERKFGLHIDALDVGCRESCLGRAPRMETDMVDAIAFTYLEVAAP